MRRVASFAAILALLAAPLLARADVTYPGLLVQQTKTLGALNAASTASGNFGFLSCTINVGTGLTGTITFKVASDQAQTLAAYAFTPQGGGSAVSTTTTSGVWQATFSGPVTACEAIVTTYGSGSASVAVTGSSNPGGGTVTVTGAPTPIPFPSSQGVVVQNTPGVAVQNFPSPWTAASPAPVQCVSGCPTPLAVQPISVASPLLVIPATIATPAAITTPASSATSVTLLAANGARNGWSACNASNQVLYLAKAATASASAFSLEFPAQGSVPTCYTESGVGVYRGIITGIWASANGNAIVTEW